MRLRFGAFLVQMGAISSEQLDRALAVQQAYRKVRLGDVLVDQGALTRESIEEALSAGGAAMPIGELLVERRAIDVAQLESALDRQKACRKMRIGEILVELGFLSAEALATAEKKHASRSD